MTTVFGWGITALLLAISRKLWGFMNSLPMEDFILTIHITGILIGCLLSFLLHLVEYRKEKNVNDLL